MPKIVTHIGFCFIFAGYLSTPLSRNRSIRFSVYSTESHFDSTNNPTLTNSYVVETPGKLIMYL